MVSHNDLRHRNRKLRADIDPEQQERAARALCQSIIGLDEYQQSQSIAAYFAVNGEISLKPLILHAWSQGKEIYLPHLDQVSLRFSPYFEGQAMRINKFRLPEPDVADDEMLTPQELDLVLAPLVVFDKDCNRIGMGGGFYDRSFSFRKNPNSAQPVLIGVAHELQKVDRLIPEDWDVRLDMVATEQAIYSKTIPPEAS